MTDLAFLGIADAADLIRARKLSPVEYAEALLDRTDRLDGRYHAFIHVTRDLALAAAHAAAKEIAGGNWRGPLHGIPTGLKDIIDCAGVPTTAHSKVLAVNVAAEDAMVTKRLKSAGAVVLGKLATHEFAIGGPSFDLPWPPAVNPLGGQPLPRRLLQRLRGRPGRGHASRRARHRYGRVRAQPSLHVWDHGHEADLRPRQPPRCLTARLLPRPCRAD